jgi:Na+-driven multidrug efflux pump
MAKDENITARWFDEDGSFESYTFATVDPGSSILFATIAFCVALYSFLPLAVAFYSSTRNVQARPSIYCWRRAPFTLLRETIGEDQETDKSEEEEGECQSKGDDERVAGGHLVSALPRLITKNKAVNDLQYRETSLRSVLSHDSEARKLYNLALPYLLKSLVSALSHNGLVVIIGQLVGTRQVAAFCLVDLLVGHVYEAVGGVHESLATLVGFSQGAGNNKLTGEYIQVAITLYVVFYVPFLYLGSVLMKDILLFIGMDNVTSEMGRSFAVPYLWACLLRGLTSCLVAVMDVCEMALLSSTLVGGGEVIATMVVLAWALLWEPSLETIGVIILVVETLMLVFAAALIGLKGWFKPYYCGLFYSVGLGVRSRLVRERCAITRMCPTACVFASQNLAAVKLMLATSSSLTAGNLLNYGEWSILAYFAGTLGPAELTAWSLMGTLWESLESFTSSIADAAEIRVALLLGSGLPNQARHAAYKSLFIGSLFSIAASSILFALGDKIPCWLTSDGALQGILSEIIPLLAVGNIALTMGTMAWTLIGAQNRYRLATGLGIAGSWLVTLPLSALLTLKYHIDLQGQTAAVVIGYAVSGFATNLFLFSSDWHQLSKEVIQYNEANDVELSDDESDDHSEYDSDIESNEEEEDKNENGVVNSSCLETVASSDAGSDDDELL